MKFSQLIEYSVRAIFLKIMQKMSQEDSFRISFWVLKKLYLRQKQVVCTLLYFNSPPLEHTIKQIV